MYRANAPNILKKYHVKRREHAEQCKIEKREQCKTGIRSVGKSERRRAHADSNPCVVRGSDGRHKVTAEDELLAHALNEKSAEIQRNKPEIDIRVKLYPVHARDHSEHGYAGHQAQSDSDAEEVMRHSPALYSSH